MASCHGSLAKALLCTLNVIFLLIAIVIIMFGFKMQMHPSFSQQEDYLLFGLLSTGFLPFSMIIFGFFIAIVSTLGFSGAVCESKFILNVYVYFVSVYSIILLLTAVAVFMFNFQMIVYFRNLFHKFQLLSRDERKSTPVFIIHNFQNFFDCCGLENPMDWFNQNFGNKTLYEELPISCCNQMDIPNSLSMEEKDLFRTCPASKISKQDGCFSPKQISRYKILVQMFFTILILLLALSLSLACCIDRDRKLQIARTINMQFASHLSNCHQTVSATTDCVRLRDTRPITKAEVLDMNMAMKNVPSQSFDRFAPNSIIHRNIDPSGLNDNSTAF
ncbi:hypothetical protein SSS_10791 [Sarcoptes scabiei]|uniref:Tetraspanin n=1 Tax=Sarcoptes scabiei TaxID=52283 RepID=A0A834R113_SARSC|nr:hypothetical protein SSS_10791 [Sarcoptes scabiei]